MKFGNIFFYNSLNCLNIALREPELLPPKNRVFSCFCEEKIALGIMNCSEHDHRVSFRSQRDKETNVCMRIWKAKSYFDLWHDSFESGKFVAALDYRICDNSIKIEFMDMNDNEYSNSNSKYGCKNDPLTNKESVKLNHALIKHVIGVAKKENKQKIIVDVHHNLRIYNKYFCPEGFVLTNRRCKDNPFWLEAEISLLE